MTSERDIWTTAQSLIKQHGDQADVYATAQYQAMLDRRDSEGMAVWNRIRRAVMELQAVEPGEGGTLKR